MTGVRPDQLWVSDEPETYFVVGVDYIDGAMTATVVPVRIEGTGPGAVIISKGKRKRVPTVDMLDRWMPTTHAPPEASTWHTRLMSDDED
jgi:hypothetical protein